MVAGMNRNDIGLLIFPRLDVLRHPGVRDAFQKLLDRLWAGGWGSANRLAGALLLGVPPQIDQGELTDKGVDQPERRADATHRPRRAAVRGLPRRRHPRQQRLSLQAFATDPRLRKRPRRQ